MDSALGWIGAIAEWCGRFFPRWQVLAPTDAAVKVVGLSLRKKHRAEEHPRIVTQRKGIVVWWPAVTDLNVVPVARQANNLQSQAIVTIDGKVFVVAGMIVYEISDVQTLVCGVYDPDDTVRDIALAAIHDACVKYSGDELLEADRSGRLNTSMKKEAVKQLADYGVRVLKMQLTDLSPARVLRLVTTVPTESKYTVA